MPRFHAGKILRSQVSSSPASERASESGEALKEKKKKGKSTEPTPRSLTMARREKDGERERESRSRGRCSVGSRARFGEEAIPGHRLRRRVCTAPRSVFIPRSPFRSRASLSSVVATAAVRRHRGTERRAARRVAPSRSKRGLALAPPARSSCPRFVAVSRPRSSRFPPTVRDYS